MENGAIITLATTEGMIAIDVKDLLASWAQDALGNDGHSQKPLDCKTKILCNEPCAGVVVGWCLEEGCGVGK